MRHWDPDGWIMNGSYYALGGGQNPTLAKSKDLKNWEFLGELLHPDFPKDLGVPKGEDISCANMFKIGDKWMLLCISHGLGARYYLGDFKDEKFLPDHHAMMNWWGWDFFAPESLLTADGRGKENSKGHTVFTPRAQPSEGWSVTHQALARTGKAPHRSEAEAEHHGEERC